jgi:oligopeptide/dipeptide ABC transporter ATP-binding protein
VDYVADEIMVMLSGLVVERGPRDLLIAEPEHPYTRLLIDSLPAAGFLEKKRPSVERSPVDGGCPFFDRCVEADALCSAELPKLEDVGGGREVRCRKRPGRR